MLPELFPVSFPGVKTSRDDVVVDTDKKRLMSRMKEYFDPEVGDSEIRAIMPTVMVSTARFDARKTRRYLAKRGFKPENVVRYCYRPFDNRWLYWEPETKLLDEKRSDYFPQIFEENIRLSAGQRNRKDAFYQPQVTRHLTDHHLVESNVGMFPLYFGAKTSGELFNTQLNANLTPEASSWLGEVHGEPIDLFFHCIAITHAPRYREENAGALRQDWPRIPPPASEETLLRSAKLGCALADVLNIEASVSGVTVGKARPELSAIASISRETGGSLNPDAGELDVTAGWGHGGNGGAVMPGKGKIIERDYTGKEREAIAEGSGQLGLTPEYALNLLGARTFDVYLNNIAYWTNIPARVWGYTIGGYQVIKKWLSYRERDILGRGLTMDEARAVTEIARRIVAIVLMEPALDANYQVIKGATYPWPILSGRGQGTISGSDLI